MLIVQGEYVVTEDGVLNDGAVLCKGNTIQSIGDQDELKQAYPEAKVIGGPGTIVLPGLVNAHHHGNGVSSFARGIDDDVLEPWLAALTVAPSVDPYLDTLWAALDLIAAGYTTVALFQSTSNPKQAKAEARQRITACLDVGLRVAFGLDLMQQNFYVYGKQPKNLPQRTGLSTDEYITLLEQLQVEYEHDPRVSIFAAPSGPQWVHDDAWKTIGEWTKQHRVPLHTHCLESPYEAEHARISYNNGSVTEYLARLGALHEYTSLVHGVFLQDADFQLMKSHGASLITNPGSNLRLRCGISPVLKALAHGVPVALGTDACTLGERDDAFQEMRLLFYLQRGVGIGTPALDWKQAFETITRSAADVTPWQQSIGSIRPGNLADFSLFDVAKAAEPWITPTRDPRHILLQRGSRHHLVATVINGQVVYDAEQGPTQVDRKEVAEDIARHLKDATYPERDDIVPTVRQFFTQWPLP